MEQINVDERTKKLTQIKENWDFWLLYCFLLLVGLFALLPRLDSLEYFYGKYLWAEDGNIFLSQAKDLGISAILDPYAGYLHVYPRLIAAISQLFELIYQPVVLLIGWFVAYFILIHALLRSVYLKERRIIYLTLLVVLVALQPHYGEVFFNITNSQWLLGAALCLYAIADTAIGKLSWIRIIFLFILTLTGPFSVILVPVLIFKLIIKKDWRDCKCTYLTIFLGAFIQFIVLLLSDRVTTGTINRYPWEWVISFLKIVNFGANDTLTVLSGFVIWMFITYLVFSSIYKNRRFDSVLKTGLILLITASLLIVAGLFSHKANPSAIIALGGGNRYTWVPYTLILTSVTLLVGKRKLLGGIIISLFGFIFYTNFHKVLSPNLQFYSFAKFSEINDVIIPIHPQWPTYPGWHISGKPFSVLSSPLPIEIKLTSESISFSGLKANFSNQNLEITATNEDPILFLLDEIPCGSHSHAGVNIYLFRKNEGWMQFFWSTTKDFNETESLRRWYPSGNIKAQFAFPLKGDNTYLRIDPLETADSAVIKKIELYCLK